MRRLRKRGCGCGCLIFILLLAVAAGLLLRGPGQVQKLLFPTDYLDEVQAACADYGVDDPWLIMAMIREESDFAPGAKSAAGACGLMQLMPDTAQWIIDEAGLDCTLEQALWQPAYNIRAGVWYIRWLRDSYYPEQGLACAIAAYNAGHTTVDGWLSDGSWDGTLGNISGMPYAETRKYVQYVYKSRDIYAKLYG